MWDYQVRSVGSKQDPWFLDHPIKVEIFILWTMLGVDGKNLNKACGQKPNSPKVELTNSTLDKYTMIGSTPTPTKCVSNKKSIIINICSRLIISI